MEEIDTSGFYCRQSNGDLLHAPNFVYNEDYELIRANKDQYTYPVFGWTWFDNINDVNI